MSDTEKKLKDAQKSIASLIKLANDRADERDATQRAANVIIEQLGRELEAERSRAEVHKQQKLNTEEDLEEMTAAVVRALYELQNRTPISIAMGNADMILSNIVRQAKDKK